MYRAANDKARTHRAWSRHHDRHVRQAAEESAVMSTWVCGLAAEDMVTCLCDNQPGRFRKAHWLTQGRQRVNPREYGLRTRQEARSDDRFAEWASGVHNG